MVLDHNYIEGSVPKVECKCCDACSDTDKEMKRDKLVTLSGDLLTDPTTPQYKAALWIVEEDKRDYTASSNYLYQRYLLVLLYNMMGEESWFTPDGRTDECKWERVGCNHDGYVEHIEFGE